MSLIKVVPYVVGVTPRVPGAPEPRLYPHSGYFLVISKVRVDGSTVPGLYKTAFIQLI